MIVTLNKNTIDGEIESYLARLSEIKEPIQREVHTRDSSYELLKYVKRDPLGVGPYPHVSLFENGNRILSDLVRLFGVKRLLFELSSQFPFTEYRVSLGTEQGMSLEAHNKGKKSLVGKAFNAAESYFSDRKRKALEKVLNHDAEYKLILFNTDAVTNSAEWDLKIEQGVYYLTIDVERYLSI